MNKYPKKMLKAAKDFQTACLSIADDKAPLEEGGWNVHQLASHTQDVKVFVYGMRARRTVEEENPEFQDFDAEAWMAEHYDPNESLVDLLDKFLASVQEAVDWLHTLPTEAWARESRHAASSGVFTLQDWVQRDIAHIEEHLKTIEEIK